MLHLLPTIRRMILVVVTGIRLLYHSHCAVIETESDEFISHVIDERAMIADEHHELRSTVCGIIERVHHAVRVRKPECRRLSTQWKHLRRCFCHNAVYSIATLPRRRCLLSVAVNSACRCCRPARLVLTL